MFHVIDNCENLLGPHRGFVALTEQRARGWDSRAVLWHTPSPPLSCQPAPPRNFVVEFSNKAQWGKYLIMCPVLCFESCCYRGSYWLPVTCEIWQLNHSCVGFVSLVFKYYYGRFLRATRCLPWNQRNRFLHGFPCQPSATWLPRESLLQTALLIDRNCLWQSNLNRISMQRPLQTHLYASNHCTIVSGSCGVQLCGSSGSVTRGQARLTVNTVIITLCHLPQGCGKILQIQQQIQKKYLFSGENRFDPLFSFCWILLLHLLGCVILSWLIR